jgi:hypothetical protein
MFIGWGIGFFLIFLIYTVAELCSAFFAGRAVLSNFKELSILILVVSVVFTLMGVFLCV